MFFKCALIFFALVGCTHDVEDGKKQSQPHKQITTQSRVGRQIVILGDSLTEGYGIDPNQAYPKQLQKRLTKNGYKVVVVNAGSSGSTSASALSRMKWILKSNPQIVMIALGANDGLRGLEVKQLKANLKKAIELALEKNVKVVLAGMQIPLNYGKKYRRQFNQVFESLAKEHPVVYIPFLLKGVGGVKKYNLPDGIHPNVKGHEVISHLVYPYLEKLL